MLQACFAPGPAPALPLSQDSLVTLDFLLAEHGTAAILGAAVAGGWVAWVGVINVVIVGQLLAVGDIPQSDDPNPPIDLICLTVWIAGMIDESRHAEAINDRLAAIHAEQVGNVAIGVQSVSLFRGDAGPRVLQDARPFGNR